MEYVDEKIIEDVNFVENYTSSDESEWDQRLVKFDISKLTEKDKILHKISGIVDYLLQPRNARLKKNVAKYLNEFIGCEIKTFDISGGIQFLSTCDGYTREKAYKIVRNYVKKYNGFYVRCSANQGVIDRRDYGGRAPDRNKIIERLRRRSAIQGTTRRFIPSTYNYDDPSKNGKYLYSKSGNGGNNTAG